MKLRKIAFVLSIFIIINSSIGCNEVMVSMEIANRNCNAWAHLPGGNNAPPALWPVGAAVAGFCLGEQPVPFPKATFCAAVMRRNTSSNCHCTGILGDPRRSPGFRSNPESPDINVGPVFFPHSFSHSKWKCIIWRFGDGIRFFSW